jgi:pantoate--beta-alanine ligase
MDVIHSVAELRERLRREPGNCFVPTMGNLHDGHLQLVTMAKPKAACTVVSIFVNRLQFGPREDFDKYPRTFEDDCDRCERAGVDVVFAPDEKEIYPEPQTFLVEPSDIQTMLEGAVRPGHFKGVATVVLKLFNMVQPHTAIFGKKDYQQCLVLSTMVRQLSSPVNLILAETVRATDGLALSSRNGYLSAVERAEAPQLYKAIDSARTELASGARDLRRIELQYMAQLAQRGWVPDYIAIRRQADLHPPEEGDRDLVILAAAKLGKTRLIDNVEVCL